MCGIAGWFDTQGERAVDRELLVRMTSSLRHRGPDGDGFYCAPGLGLGHRRLAIIDLVSGAQPMLNASGTVAITFNGEIYNFRELREDLCARGYRFATASDTEVILHGWEEWGEDCVERFTGMFALAIWDSREKTLFLARDRLGEKPLYYALLPDRGFIFGSELKSLLVNTSLERRIDPCAVEEFFALGYVAEPRTIYGGVSRLPAGTTLTIVRGQKPRMRSYWQPHPGETIRGDADAITGDLIDRLAAAVKAQLVSDVPIGAFLSGGVDSSGTAALMAKATTAPIRCFSIGFTDPRFNETEYAASVARRYNAEHIVETLTGTETDLVGSLPGIFDEPFGDSSALPALSLARLARRHVTVALSGDAGDELFGGYRRYAFHAAEERIRSAIPAWIRTPVFGLLGRIYPQLDWAPRAFRARHTLRELAVDPAEGYFWNLSIVDDDTRAQLYSSSMRRALAGYSACDVIREHWKSAPDLDPVATAQFVDLKTWLPSDILTKVDRTAMAASLEVRVPMLDHRFVEWALGLPRAMKIAGGESKFILKRAFERLVPREVLYRPKQGFSVPLAAWFRGALGEAFARDISGRNGLSQCGFFDVQMIDRLIAQHRSGLSDHSRTLWLLWMFQGFLRHVHGTPVAGCAQTDFAALASSQ